MRCASVSQGCEVEPSAPIDSGMQGNSKGAAVSFLTAALSFARNNAPNMNPCSTSLVYALTPYLVAAVFRLDSKCPPGTDQGIKSVCFTA